MSINLYASISCDWIEHTIDRLVYQGDEAGLKRFNQALENAQQIWEGWALEFDATILSRGTEIRIKFPAEKLGDIPGLRKQFAGAIDSPVSVGVGTSLDDAERAQQVALRRGGDQMILWTPELADELEESEELSKAFRSAAFRHLRTGEVIDSGVFHDLSILPGGEDDIGNYESGFLDDAGHFFNRAQARAKTHQTPQSETLLGGLGQVKKGLKKAIDQGPGSPGPGESPETTAKPNKPNAGGGLSYRQQPNQGGVPQPPMAEASEHSQGEAMRALADETSSPSGSGVADDFEGALHDHAQEQDKKDKDAEEAANGKAEARKKVVEILTQVKQFAPQLEQLKEQAPDIYAAVVGLVQALMITGQGLLEDDSKDSQTDSEKVVDQKKEDSGEKEVSKAELGQSMYASAPQLRPCLSCGAPTGYADQLCGGSEDTGSCATKFHTWASTHHPNVIPVDEGGTIHPKATWTPEALTALDEWLSLNKSELQKAWPTKEEDEGAKVAQDYLLSGGGSPGTVGAGQELGVKSTLPLVAHKIVGDVGPARKWVPGSVIGVPQSRVGGGTGQVRDPSQSDPAASEPQLVPGKETAVGYRRAWATHQANQNNPERYGPEMDAAHYGGKHPDWSKMIATQLMDRPGDTHTENIVWSAVADRALDAAVPFPNWPSPVDDYHQLSFQWQTLGPGATHHALNVYSSYPGVNPRHNWVAWLPVNKQTGQVDMNYLHNNNPQNRSRLSAGYEHLPELISEHLKDKVNLIKSESLEKAWPRSEKENQETQVAHDELLTMPGSTEVPVIPPAPGLTGSVSQYDRPKVKQNPLGLKLTGQLHEMPEHRQAQLRHAGVSERVATSPQIHKPDPSVKPAHLPGPEGIKYPSRAAQERAHQAYMSNFYQPSGGVSSIKDTEGALETLTDESREAAHPIPSTPVGFAQALLGNNNVGGGIRFKWSYLPENARRFPSYGDEFRGPKTIVEAYHPDNGIRLGFFELHPEQGFIPVQRTKEPYASAFAPGWQPYPAEKDQNILNHLNDWLKANPMAKSETPEQIYDPMKFDPQVLAAATQHEMEHTSNRDEAQKIAMDHLMEDPNYYIKLQDMQKDELEKAKLPLPENAPKHTHLNLPVGASKDGKVKVLHPEEGKEGWVSVRAGQVLSNDGHPISSRNPGGR